MLPTDTTTAFHLILLGVFALMALQFRIGRSAWMLTLIAIAMPTAYLWCLSPTGQYAGLAYAIVGGGAFLAAGAGGIAGALARLLPSTVAVSGIFGLAITGSVGLLWFQYVPDRCSTLQVSIAGKVLAIPKEVRPRLERDDFVGHFGRAERKADTARMCRESSNGAIPVQMDTIWITPASAHKRMTQACREGTRPKWCSDYVSVPFRRIGKVLISSDRQRTAPLYYWNASESPDIWREGDLDQGRLCIVSRVTQCSMWEPFGTEGHWIMIETSNLDATFEGMPKDEALPMLVPVRDMLFGIIDRD